LYRGISDFKKGCQAQNNILKNDGYLVTDSHSIFSGLRNHFSWLQNLHVVNDVRQTEIHTAEPFVPELSSFKVEVATEKLKRHRYIKI